MNSILAIILSIITVLVPPAQIGGGCVVSSGADIPADLDTAQAGSRCLELPVGVFTVQPGVLLAFADNLTIRGAGMGRTILQLPDDLAVSAPTYALRLTGAHQSVSDLTIRGGLNASGAASVAGISIYSPATGTHVQRVELTALYGGNTAGAAGIDLYQPWNVNGGVQSALVEDCTIHAGPNMTGIVVNSNGNTIRNNRIADVGNTTARHGIYIQGGYNLIEGNTIERVGGYSLHAWQKVQSIDGSGNVFAHNTSIDPGFQHMIVSGLLSNGTNPAIPNGKPLTRNVTIESNLFRNTAGRQTSGISTDVPALIESNTFEDVTKEGGAIIGAGAGAGGSVVTNNAIRVLLPTTPTGARFGILADSVALISNNSIDMASVANGIGVRVPRVQVLGNRITASSGVGWQAGVRIASTESIVSGNVIDLPLGSGIVGTPLRASDNAVWIAGVLQ